MTHLLDTQVALWWLTGSSRLSRESRALAGGSPCAVSVASIWEVAIKHRLGKLPVEPRRFRDEMLAAGARILAVTDEHALVSAELPIAHRDPFDRLLLAVATTDHLTFLTADSALVALSAMHPRLPIREA